MVRQAKFLGWKSETGTVDHEPAFDMEHEENEEYLRNLKVGTILELVPDSVGRTLHFPYYFFVGEEKCYLRPSEYELLTHKPLVVEDWL